MTKTGFRLVWGGTAQVYCVHDREKRQVVTEEQVAALGLQVGVMYNSKIHKLHECSCCGNLFVAHSTEPKYCDTCSTPPIHVLGGKLPDPKGVVG